MSTVFKRLSINQMLFMSHLCLVLLVIAGLSITRYESEWQRQVDYSAAFANQALQSQVHFFSTSVAGVNYDGKFYGLAANLDFGDFFVLSELNRLDLDARVALRLTDGPQKKKSRFCGSSLSLNQETQMRWSIFLNSRKICLAPGRRPRHNIKLSAAWPTSIPKPS